MTKPTSEITPVEPVPASQVQPVQIPPVSPPIQTTPQASGRPGCGYTLLIVVITVICTLILQAILIAALVGYVGSKIAAGVKDFSSSTPTTNADGTPKELTKDQKELLSSIGVDPKDLPPEIPVEKVSCAIEAIGEQRVKDIINNKVTPGFADIFKLRSCI